VVSGEWSEENRVQATPTTPAYTDTYLYTYQLAEVIRAFYHGAWRGTLDRTNIRSVQ